jgi:hypothetical protein
LKFTGFGFGIGFGNFQSCGFGIGFGFGNFQSFGFGFGIGFGLFEKNSEHYCMVVVSQNRTRATVIGFSKFKVRWIGNFQVTFKSDKFFCLRLLADSPYKVQILY